MVGQPALARFILLSMLLHAAIVVLFGTSHGGGAGRGERSLDVLDVTLRRPTAEPDAGKRLFPGADTAAGRALLRYADQPAQPNPSRERSEPGVAPAPSSDVAPTERASVEPRPTQPKPDAAPAIDALPRIDLRAAEQVDAVVAPPAIQPSSPARIERLAPARRPPELAPPFEAAPRTAPIVPDAPIERLAAPTTERELAPPVELAPRVAPSIPDAPIERFAAPTTERALAPPIELAPRVAPSIPDAPIERLAAPMTERALAPPIELAPRVAPVVPASIDRLVVPRIANELASPASLVAPDAPAAQTPGASPVASPTTEPVAPSATPSRREAIAPAPPAELPRLRLGSPVADDDPFKPRRDVVTPPSEPGGAPRIDMGAARMRAREIASEAGSARGILPALPPPAERKSKEGLALEKAIKPDCRTAYSGMGLLAVPALVVSAIGDGGCRW